MVAPSKVETKQTRVPHLKVTLRKLAKSDTAICDRMGGNPNQWADNAPWPICGSCGETMCFAFQLLGEKAGGKARIGAATAVQVFVCHSESGCSFYEMGSDANHVALRKKPLLAQVAKRPKEKPSEITDDPLRVGKRITYTEAWDDKEGLQAFDDDRRFNAANGRGFVDKLYGLVATANKPEAVKCKKCRTPLPLLAQVLSADDWFAYFLHACPKGHEVVFQGTRA